MATPLDTSAANLNSVLFPLLGPTAGNGSQSIEDCILELASAIAKAKHAGVASANTKQFVSDLLLSPIKEVGNALSELFMLDQATNSDCFEGEDGKFYSDSDGQPCSPTMEAMGNYSDAVRQAMEDPFFAMAGAALNVLQVAGDQAIAVFDGSNDTNADGTLKNQGLNRQVASRVSLIIRQLIFNAKSAPTQIGGLVMFSLEHGIPAIEAELLYLRQMKALVKDTVSEASSLPPSMIPSFPNASATTLLCEAELHLRNVRDGLNTTKKFNRSELSQATDKTCRARDVIYSGGIDEAFLSQLKNLYGLTDLQYNTIKNMKFMPDPTYRLRTLQLIKYNALLQNADVTVQVFYKNLQKFLVNLDGLTGIHIADILAMIIEVIRREIATVRAMLEADASGFDLQADALGIANTNPASTQNRSATKLSDNKAARQATPGRADVFSYASTQATAYVALSVLCPLLQKVQLIYDKIRVVLEANDSVLALIKKVCGDLQTGSCGANDGADRINESLQTFLSATENRLDGISRGNQGISTAGQALLAQIEHHQTFLLCFRDKVQNLHLNLGIDPAIIAAAMNIAALVKRYPELKQSLQNLSPAALGDTNDEINVSDALIKAIQCLLLQCGNTFLSSTARQAMETLDGLSLVADSSKITIGKLDEGTRKAAQVGNNRRLQNFLRAIQSLQRLTSININTLCDIKPTSMQQSDESRSAAKKAKQAELDAAKLSGVSTAAKGTLDSREAAPVDQGVAAQRASRDQKAAAAGATPLAGRIVV